MKIRYYLRGLGLGILVTSIFFMVSGKNSKPMSDEMIKARAKELGMSESVVLAELATEVETTETEITEVETTDEVTEEVSTTEIATEEMTTTEALETDSAETEETVTEESVSEETVAEEVSEENAEETEPELPESTASNTEPVTVTVNRGEGSDTVSRRLQEAGLVADAYEYDRYLMANGYDKRIGAGNHVIPAGATWEDIAKILCNMK